MRALFAQAAGLPPEERGPFLDAACRGEPDLRAQVAGLLAFDSDSFGVGEDEQGFLKSPLVPRPRERRPNPRYCRGEKSPGCPLTSAVIASSAVTGKVAWAPSTRLNRTTHPHRRPQGDPPRTGLTRARQALQSRSANPGPATAFRYRPGL